LSQYRARVIASQGAVESAGCTLFAGGIDATTIEAVAITP